MAKRFTDTNKWAKASFGELPLKMKLIWLYLCDNCDHAGVWDINLRLMSFHIGENVTLEEIEKGLGDKVKVLTSSLLFIPSFVEFQYGALNNENRAHKSVINRLEKLGASKGLIRSSQGRKDKDKDKEQDKEKGSAEGKNQKAEIGAKEVYAKYPLKLGKKDGVKALATRLEKGLALSDAMAALQRFIDHHKTRGTDKNFLPYFSTWVNDLEDWLDPETGKAEDFKKPQRGTGEFTGGWSDIDGVA